MEKQFEVLKIGVISLFLGECHLQKQFQPLESCVLPARDAVFKSSQIESSSLEKYLLNGVLLNGKDDSKQGF